MVDIPPDVARESILDKLRQARDLAVLGEVNGCIAILHSLIGADGTAPTTSVDQGRALDLKGFFQAFLTACRKNGVMDAAYVIGVPVGGGKIKTLIGGHDGIANWLGSVLSEARATKTEVKEALAAVGAEALVSGKLKSELSEFIREALIAPDPESSKLAALEFIVLQDRPGSLPLEIAQTPDIGVANEIVRIIREGGSDAILGRRLLPGG